ncbi:S8 family serine peptidase [soil metagenome]
MKKILPAVIIVLFSFFTSEAQYSKYIIRFKDKAGTPFNINNPTQFLTQRSVDRRSRQKIKIDETDLPITPRYLDSVRLAGNVKILNVSKWLNQVAIETTDAVALNKIAGFTFVINTTPVRIRLTGGTPSDKFKETFSTGTSTLQPAGDYYNYGSSYDQIHFHEGEFLHNNGFHGEGMLVAIIDAGFYGYLTNPYFDSVRNAGRVKETYDFVNNEISVNEDHPHGMQCFGLMAANKPGELVGTCPNATFYLYRTEEAATEYPIEEQNWVAAAERADSIGVDVLSTSLGYTTFDNPVFNHTYADMNGRTTIIAKGNTLSARKGIISVVAAGNEGSGIWHYISTPADTDSILTVGASNVSGTIAGFSGYGPASDNRIKPDVASIGVGDAVSSTSGTVTFGNGTSYAAPNLAGLVTCLWQAFQDFTNMEIIDAVKKSSPTYTTPDNRKGYGFPNFKTAFNYLTEQRLLRNPIVSLGNDWIKVFPNPFRNNFNVALKIPSSANATLLLFNAAGKLVVKQQVKIIGNQQQQIKFENLILERGVYILKYDNGANTRSVKLLVK